MSEDRCYDRNQLDMKPKTDLEITEGIKKNITEGIKEVRLIQAGKLAKVSLREFLEELDKIDEHEED